MGLVRPFLRWAGGKQRLIRDLLRFAPATQSYGRYYEPFVGAGSMFFAIRPPRATLGDINTELINCYQAVATAPEDVSRILATYSRRHSREFFYNVRSRRNSDLEPAERAAHFIYLNKAAFNGIYRVNMKGIFNVPYGPVKPTFVVPTVESLKNAGECLSRTSARADDFEKCVSRAREGDFVYLDPPYPPHSETGFFAHYSSERFHWKEQERLATVFYDLAKRGCYVMLSNADRPEVVTLYKDFFIRRLDALRWLGSNGDRFAVRELVVTNYRVLRNHEY